MNDAIQTQVEVHLAINKLIAKGFKGLTNTLVDIEQSLTKVVNQMSHESDTNNITKLEMEYLQLKNRFFYQKLAVNNDVQQADYLAKRAVVLLDQMRANIKLQESQSSNEMAEILRIDVQQLELFSAILQNEKPRKSLHYIGSLLSNVERNIKRKWHTIELEIKQLELKKKIPHESYYTTMTFGQVLQIVLNNLRAQGKFSLANEIEQLANYVIGLEKIKTSGKYRGTQMENTLDQTIRVNKNKLVSIINQLINQ